MADVIRPISRRAAAAAIGVTALLPVAAEALTASRQHARLPLRKPVPPRHAPAPHRPAAAAHPAHREKTEEETGAVEDMMREHGVLRRILFVYSETATALGEKDAQIDPGALRDAATLFRDFGEDYHEQKLEEEHVFPELRRLGANSSLLADILTRQHRRGREITAYILSSTAGGRISDSAALAGALASMTRMYRPHSAREDTVVFPVWKKLHTPAELDAIAEQFEGIERSTFGHDGFDDAIRRIAAIEQKLGLADLDRFTAPPIRT